MGLSVDSTVVRFLLVAAFCLVFVVPVGAEEGCNTPGNLTYNCNFDRFQRQPDGKDVPEGWVAWVLMGSPAFDVDDHGSAPGAPAQRIWSDGGVWTAGLYQQVQVAPGKWYEAKIDWAAPSVANIERKVGIDPSGGTNPASPNIVWGNPSVEEVRMPDLRATAFAQGGTVTVYVWTHHGMSFGADQVFLDAVTLVERPDLSPPTPTPAPPTNTPTPRPPTRTPAPPTPAPASPSPSAGDDSPPIEVSPTPEGQPLVEASPTPTPTATLVLPTDTPLPTETFTPSPPPPTLTPTPTRTPTITPLPVAQLLTPPVVRPAVQAQRSGSRPAPPPEILLLYIAGVAVVVAALLLSVGVYLWLRSHATTGGEDQGGT